MPSPDQGFCDYIVQDLLDTLPQIRSRAMFGGFGIYSGNLMFALIAMGELYFKVDQTNQSDFEEIGSHPFVYSQGKHGSTTLSYWVIPEQLLENRVELIRFAQKAIQVARAAADKKRATKKVSALKTKGGSNRSQSV